MARSMCRWLDEPRVNEAVRARGLRPDDRSPASTAAVARACREVPGMRTSTGTAGSHVMPIATRPAGSQPTVPRRMACRSDRNGMRRFSTRAFATAWEDMASRPGESGCAGR